MKVGLYISRKTCKCGGDKIKLHKDPCPQVLKKGEVGFG